MKGLLLSLAFSEFIVMIDEHFNLCIEYKSKPRLFSKYSFILIKTGSYFFVNPIEKLG
jgi:hypothetical protein